MIDPTEPPQPETRTCVNCGFLCRRDTLNTHLPIYAEFTREDRERGTFFRLHAYHMPWCFRDEPILQAICDLSGLGAFPPGGRELDWVSQQNEAARVLLNQASQCPLWFPYKAGVPPDRRFEHLKMQTLEQRRQDFDERMQAKSEETQRAMRLVTMIGVGLQLTVAVVAIIVSLYIANQKQPITITLDPAIVMPTPEPPSMRAP